MLDDFAWQSSVSPDDNGGVIKLPTKFHPLFVTDWEYAACPPIGTPFSTHCTSNTSVATGVLNLIS